MQLPEEASEFVNIDQVWNKLMQETRKNTLILAACRTPERQATLQRLVERLDKCQRSLSDYLETKRVLFQDFFSFQMMNSFQFLVLEIQMQFNSI